MDTALSPQSAHHAVLTHVACHVHDLEGMVRFYSDYCGMCVVHDRDGRGGDRVVWMAEPGREKELIFVFISGGPRPQEVQGDFSHMGFALKSRDAVDALAKKAREMDCLAWEPCQEDYPVGYYCALRDPQGNYVEFSYGQPLGPGAEQDQNGFSHID